MNLKPLSMRTTRWNAVATAVAMNQAEMDPGSLYTVGKAIGARAPWPKTDKSGRRLTGLGSSRWSDSLWS